MRELLDYFDTVVRALRQGDRAPDPERILRRFDGLAPELPSEPATRPRSGGLSVAIVCREYPPETAYGGMATFSRHLALGLVAAGHRVTVVALGRPAAYRDLDGRVDVVRILPRLRGMDEPFETMGRTGRLTFGQGVFLHSLAVYRQLRDLEQVHGPFDVLDLADHAAEGLGPAMFLARPTTVRLYSPLALLAAMPGRLVVTDDADEVAVLEKWLLDRCDLVTSPSRDLALRVRTFFGLDRPIPIVPNPLDTDLFSPGQGTRRRDRVRVCFVGRLAERKGIRTLIAAIPEVLRADARVEFVIVGADVEGVAAGHRDVFPRDRVRFLPPVTLEALPQVYRDADIVVVPSNYDNSPYTAIEPMACGVPVVGTASGGTAEYVSDGETGIIVPARDPAALAEALVRLVRNDELRVRLGRAGVASARETCDYRRVAALMEGHYRAVIDRRPPDVVACPTAGPSVNRACPEKARVELVTPATRVDRALRRTLESAFAEGVAATVVWSGSGLPRLPYARVVRARESVGVSAGRTLGATLAEYVAIIVPGQVLRPGIIERGVCRLAWTGYHAVVLDGVSLLEASHAWGRIYTDAATWQDVIDTVVASASPREGIELPPVPPWEPPPVSLAPVASRTRAWRKGARRLVTEALFHPRLRLGRHLGRRVLEWLPAGAPVLARIRRQQLEFTAPTPYGRPTRVPRLTVVGVSGDSVQRLAQASGIRHCERWTLCELLPRALWLHAVCYLLRTRPPGLLRIADDVPLGGLPPQYREALRGEGADTAIA